MVVSCKQGIANAVLPCRSFEAIQEFLGLLLVQFEFRADGAGIAAIKTVFGELLLFQEANVAVGLVCRPAEIVNTLNALKESANALEAVGQFDRDGIEINPAALLEVGELGDLQSVEENLPADAPGAEGGRLPIVLFEANVVLLESDAECAEALEVDVLHLGRRRLENHLKLVVLVKAVGVFTIASVGGPRTRRKVSGCMVPAPISTS